MANVKGHKRYRTKDDKIVVSATTVVGSIAKPALIKWANKLGLDGVDSTKYIDDAAEIGVLSHAIITEGLRGRITDFSNYDQNQRDSADWCVHIWESWAQNRLIEPILIEEPLVSERFRYGGTLDIYAKVDDILTLIELKTTNDIWPEHHIQVSAHRQLLMEHDYSVDSVRILNIPRDRTRVFQEVILGSKVLELNWKIFKHLLRIHELRKELNG